MNRIQERGYQVQKIVKLPISWDQMEELWIDNYPWYQSGLKQDTLVKLCYDEESLYLHVWASDVHSSAKVLEQNGSVYLDSAFEFFFRPNPEISDYYMNLEINCIGTVYLAMRNEEGKRRAEADEINAIQIRTSLEKGMIKEVSPDDHGWEMEIRIPFSLIQKVFGKIDPKQWSANFYRCGGEVDDQYAVWNPIVTPKPDFHQPRQFGRLIFLQGVHVNEY